jgi:hypothetical protein
MWVTMIVFGSTCTCEKAFSHTQQNKPKFQLRITEVHLYEVLQIDI